MDLYQALAEPKRREIIELLARSEGLTSTDISSNFDISAPAISQHLKILRQAKLVDMEKRAQSRIYTINTSSLDELENWVRKTKERWEHRFNRLDEALKDLKENM